MGTETSENKSGAGQLPTYIVGIGASAGGLEAIETFFREMPTESGLVFVVIQHLSPDYKSLMVELLSKRTEMRVFRAEEGMAVVPDAVYLIPPKKNLTIFHGKLLLNEQDHQRGINLPIDIFFRSLAQDQGEKAVAIVLSGTGSDGTRGIRSIKEHGGMVMVQDELSAKFNGMPRSAIATGLADFILPPEKMPPHLLSYIKHPYVTRTERSETISTDEDDLTRIFALIRDKSKVDFTYYKPTTVNRRIERRMSVNQIHDLREYVRLLENNPSEVGNLYRELLIGVTSFFRDKDAFDSLSGKWMPELIRKKQDQNLRLWVVGCSTGEEAYSLAIVCRECMENCDKLLDVKIFATDVDRNAILQAGSGIYPESIAADLSPRILNKYFYKRDDNFQVMRNIREMVVFAQHNLIKDPPFTSIDMISCRNLLIYLQPILQTKAMELFNFSLRPSGLLMLGTSETTGEMAEYFKPVETKQKIYKSLGRPKQIQSSSPVIVSHSRHPEMPQGRLSGGQRLQGPFFQERMLDRLLDLLAREYVPLTLVVDEQLEILHVIGRTEGFIQVPPGRMSNNLTKMIIKELALPLATSIQKVFKTREPVLYSNFRVHRQETEAAVNIKVAPLPEKFSRPPLAAVFLEEVERIDVVKNRQAQATYDISIEAEQRINDLEQQLQFTRENLQATIEELETSNEELQATNEELLASNEELQSTNEELQSVNEELHTVNAEHQRKIMELTELNNDLENMYAGTKIGMLFLDENLDLRRFTPQIAHLFNIMDSDIGRPLAHLTHRLPGVPVGDLVRKVQSTGTPVEKEVLSDDGTWYLMRILPYQVAPRIYSGVVLSFIDIHLLKTAQAELETIQQEHTLTQYTTNTGTWSMNINSGVCQWSDTMAFLVGIAHGGLGERFEDYLAAVHAEDRVSVARAVQTCRGDRSPMEFEHRVNKPDGTVRWLAVKGVVTDNPGENAPRMFCVARDITDRINAETAERRIETITCSLADIIMVHDLDNHIMAWNEEAEHIYEWRRTESIGMSVDRLIPPSHRKAYQEIIQRVVRKEAVNGFKTVRVTKSGRKIDVWLKASPILGRRGDTEAVAITERVISR